MIDLLRSLPPDLQFVLCLLSLLCATGVLIAVPVSLAYIWRRAERDRRAGELGHEMIAAGFAAPEVRDALAAAFPADPAD